MAAFFANTTTSSRKRPRQEQALQPTLLRIKRKRTDTPLETLYIEGDGNAEELIAPLQGLLAEGKGAVLNTRFTFSRVDTLDSLQLQDKAASTKLMQKVLGSKIVQRQNRRHRGSASDGTVKAKERTLTMAKQSRQKALSLKRKM
jgi:hypothetical protein